MSLKKELDALALSLLETAREAGASADSRIDTFKAVSAYYLGTQRANKGRDDEDTERRGSFRDIVEKMNGATIAGDSE